MGWGCGDDEHTETPDAAEQPPPDASAPDIDAANPVDAGPDVDAAPPGPFTFRLSYDPAPGPPSSIYVQIACTETWIRVLDGDTTVPIQSDCGLCRCDACDSCAICDCAFLIEPIAAGASRDYAWDGVTHPSRDQDGCGTCEYDDTLAPGTYTARFCWSFTEDGALECADETFDYPTDGVVEHVVTGP